jgi:Right handed beta helix region
MTQSARALALFAGSMLTLLATDATAIAQRTFVSTGGSDANPCSLAAPCRSFGAAIAQTLDSGEIVVLDSGGYGPVVINKSVDIIAPAGVYAGITASAGTRIQVVSPALNVAIRGVAINGLGTGQFGIDVQFGSQVTIERCRIANFAQDGLRNDSGASLALRDSEIRDNGGNGATLDSGRHTIERTTFRHNEVGVSVVGATVQVLDSIIVGNQSDGLQASGNALLTIIGGEVISNGNFGVYLNGSVASANTRVAIDRATISNNTVVGVAYNASSTNAIVQLAIARSLFVENFNAVQGGAGAAGAAARIFVSDSVFERNAQTGLGVSGTGAELTISSNVVTGSSSGVSKSSGGVIYTRQNNTVRGNTNDLVGTPYINLGGS